LIRRKQKEASIIPINVYGDKILRKKVDLVKDIDFETVQLIKNMFQTMREANGIGLAANQVGINQSIFVVDVSPLEGYEHIKPVVMINPQLAYFSDEEVSIEEGCLSLPNLRAEVLRPKQVQVKYYDTDMKEQSVEADELFARVIQHEYDHLQGIFFTDKLSEPEKKRLRNELTKIKERKVEVDYPITEKQ